MLTGKEKRAEENWSAAGLWRQKDLPGVIKYEGDGKAIVWKHPAEDFRMGTQLIVHESQEAVFFRDGQAVDLFGPGRYTLQTQQLPLMNRLYRLPTNPEGTFHSEVYFINKTVLMAMKWGTPDRVRCIEPLTGLPVEIGASGELNLQVEDSRRLLVKLVGTQAGIAWDDPERFELSVQQAFQPLIVNTVKVRLPAVIAEQQIDLLRIDESMEQIAAALQEKLAAGFAEYGLRLPQFYLNHVVLPEEDPNFRLVRELRTVTLQNRVHQARAEVLSAQARSEAAYRIAQEETRAAVAIARRKADLEDQETATEIARREADRALIQAQAQADAARLLGQSEAVVMREKGLTGREVLDAEVRKSYAAALAQMGTGQSSSGGFAGLGVSLGAMSGLMNMTRGMLDPMLFPQTAGAAPLAGAFPEETWQCACGQKALTGNFCPMCGAKRPQPENDA